MKQITNILIPEPYFAIDHCSENFNKTCKGRKKSNSVEKNRYSVFHFSWAFGKGKAHVQTVHTRSEPICRNIINEVVVFISGSIHLSQVSCSVVYAFICKSKLLGRVHILIWFHSFVKVNCSVIYAFLCVI